MSFHTQRDLTLETSLHIYGQRCLPPMEQKLSSPGRICCLCWLLDCKDPDFYHLVWPLTLGDCIKCSGPFLCIACLSFSCSDSFWAFFLSSSSCLQFSSCARSNILVKSRSVETTAILKTDYSY